MTSAKILPLQIKPFVKNWHTWKPILEYRISAQTVIAQTRIEIYTKGTTMIASSTIYTICLNSEQKFSQSRSEICVFFFLYKIVRYFSSHNGVPSINIVVSSKTDFVYVADYDSFLMTPIKTKKKLMGEKLLPFDLKSICSENALWWQMASLVLFCFWFAITFSEMTRVPAIPKIVPKSMIPCNLTMPHWVNLHVVCFRMHSQLE